MRGFIEESREHLDTIEADLLAIEEGGSDIDENRVNKVFRAAHSIKGGSGFFGLEKIKTLAHKAETVLDKLRSRKLVPGPGTTNVLLAAFDRLREMIEDTQASAAADISALLADLEKLASAPALGDVPSAPVSETVPENLHGGFREALTPQVFERARQAGRFLYHVECELAGEADGSVGDPAGFLTDLERAGEILFRRVEAPGRGSIASGSDKCQVELLFATVLEPGIVDGLFLPEVSARIRLEFDPRGAKVSAAPAPAIPVPAPVAPAPALPPTPVSMSPAIPSSDRKGTTTASEETLRVDVKLLETLMNLAGELVLSRNQMRAAMTHADSALLGAAEQRIHQVTSELQDVIMQTRLQPIQNVFAKFPRLVRDLSRSLGKEIRLEMLGREVALDKTLIEGLSDPLIHMVRNAVDHGIETAEERLRAGKPAAGAVRIEARHEAGQVVVEIEDDGRGLDPDRLAEVALRKGLVSAEKLAGLPDREKQALVFLPGLTTAKQLTDVSGRGVGMDVVKTNLDRLGGQVDISSARGRGTTFRIKLPLTLAIIPSLLVSAEGESFAIPQNTVEELLRLRPEEIRHRIERIGEAEVLLLRDRLLPLARLSDILGMVATYYDAGQAHRDFDRRGRIADRRSPRSPGPDSDSGPGDMGGRPRPNSPDRRRAPASALEIAVLNAGTFSFGLVVGSLHRTEEVVAKPLGRRFKGLREYSGATILGDGTVALILDAGGLAAKAGLATVSDTARAKALAAEAEARNQQEARSLLLFQNGSGEPCALPLDRVQRIEHIRPDQVELRGGRRSMAYRGHSLSLVALSDAGAGTPLDGKAGQVVLVSVAGGLEVGLLGTPPLDVVEVTAALDVHTHRRKGVAGSVLHCDRTLLIPELDELMDAAHPGWRNRSEAATPPGADTSETTVGGQPHAPEERKGSCCPT